MTPEAFARRFADFLSGPDEDRDMTPEEHEFLQEIARAAEDPQACARMRQIIRSIPSELYRRRWNPEQLAEILGVSPDDLIALAVAGRLTGTHGPTGWMFGVADIYPLLFPDEPAS